MSNLLVRVGLGTRFMYDGEIAEVVELSPTATGTHVVLKVAGRQLVRITLRALLDTDGVHILGDGADSTVGEPPDPATIVLANLEEPERSMIRHRARHVREILTGYQGGHQLLATANEPRPQYEPHLSLTSRYEAKAQPPSSACSSA